MEHALGLLRVKVIRGINLVKKDANGSDPYVVLKLGKQKFKTSVKKNNSNPQWNEDLTLCITHTIQPILLKVYDKDRFSRDDKLGNAELDISKFMEAVKMDFTGISDGTLVTTVQPTRQNCLAEQSSIVWKDGMVVQDLVLRLRKVKSGEIELQLTWVNIPGSSF